EEDDRQGVRCAPADPHPSRAAVPAVRLREPVLFPPRLEQHGGGGIPEDPERTGEDRQLDVPLAVGDRRGGHLPRVLGVRGTSSAKGDCENRWRQRGDLAKPLPIHGRVHGTADPATRSRAEGWHGEPTLSLVRPRPIRGRQKREFYSNILGEHSYFALRAHTNLVRSHIDAVNVLATFEAETLFRHARAVTDDGAIVYDPALAKTRLSDIPTIEKRLAADLKTFLISHGVGETIGDLLAAAKQRGVALVPIPFKDLLDQIADEFQIDQLSKISRVVNMLA